MKHSWSRPVLAVLTPVVILAAWFAASLLNAGAPAGRAFDAVPADEGVMTVESGFVPPAAGKPGCLWIRANIKPGWHIYSITQPKGGPLATKIKINLPQGVRLAGEFSASPTPKKNTDPAFDNLPVETHVGTVTWSAPLESDASVDPATAKIGGKVTAQGCDASSCEPPRDYPFSAFLSAKTPTTSGTTVARSIDYADLAVKLSLAFLGGLILNLMPCVLPVISLKILAFVQQAGESRGRIFALNVWYSLGLLSVFMVLATLAASAGLAWGEQFTLPWFKVAMTAFVFAMALSFLGVWQIPIPGFVGAGRANQLQSKEGPSGAFFKGVFTTILATPCSGPFLGSVFGYLLKQPSQVVYYVFAAIGLGMASPYLVVGAFPRLIRSLPKPGAWMDAFEQLMGFLLLATVVYLFNTLTHWYFVPAAALLVGVWFACWWIGRTPLTATPRARIAAWLGGPVVAALVGVFAFTVLFWEPVIPWQPFTPEALQRARAEGKTVMIDFTANWCPNCKLNSKFAIERTSVLKLVSENGVVPMLADWTDHSPTIKKSLHDLGYNSIPLLAIWPANPADAKPIVLPDLLSEGAVLDALKKAGPSRGQ
ncbi:MAG: thioredoxin family protein [Planctomycetaceae bacterium]|nr:thioredoxin family protein [Planctomycetaceae bacterium]